MDAHSRVFDVDPRLEPLAAGVLLDVSLVRLQRRVEVRPVLERDDGLAHRRVRDERRCHTHQKICPFTTWPTRIATAKPTRIAVSRMKKRDAGPASSVVNPPHVSTG